jgi:large subunit ribosomal protein L17
MNHQNGRKKLNLSQKHKKALLRNQAIFLINYGHIVSTKARLKEVRRFVEKLVTIAKDGKNFNNIRKVKSILPYKNDAIFKLFDDIAPRYENRLGGYTRLILMGKRVSDTADIARLEWVL